MKTGPKFVMFETLAQLTKFINKILTRQAQIKPKKKKKQYKPRSTLSNVYIHNQIQNKILRVTLKKKKKWSDGCYIYGQTNTTLAKIMF